VYVFLVIFGSVGFEKQTNDGLVCLREILADVRCFTAKLGAILKAFLVLE